MITRNQEQFVERLLESILAEVASTGSEVVLVDSVSDDGTVEAAARYPITVLRIRRGLRLTPPAGRYIGFHRTTGDLILFIDGDMELCPGWLERAAEVVRSDDRIAVVTGIVVDPADAPVAQERGVGAVRTVELPWWRAGGIALYRREPMERLGTFDPGLYSDGEPELWLRLTRAGYQVVRLEQVAAIHHGDAPRVVERRRFASLLARRRRRLFLGYGQIARLLLGKRALWSYLRHRGYGLLPLAALVLGVAAFAWFVVTGAWVGIVGWLVLVVLVVALDAIRKRSLYRAAYSLLNRVFIVEGMVRGFVALRIEPASFLDGLEVLGEPSSEPSRRRIS